jgi:hypothetical protein
MHEKFFYLTTHYLKNMENPLLIFPMFSAGMRAERACLFTASSSANPLAKVAYRPLIFQKNLHLLKLV